MREHHGSQSEKAEGVLRKKVARLTGLEPATPGVTGRYSNQLSYNRALPKEARSFQCALSDACRFRCGSVARLTGLEPATPGVTGRYSNHLSYNRPLPDRGQAPNVRGVLWPVRALVKRGIAKKCRGREKTLNRQNCAPKSISAPASPPSCPTRVSLSAPSFLKPLFERFPRCWSGPDAPNTDKWHEASQDMCKIGKITAILPPPLGLIDRQIEKKYL